MKESIQIKFKRVLKEGLNDLRYFGPSVASARIFWIIKSMDLESTIRRNQVLKKKLCQDYQDLIRKYQGLEDISFNKEDTDIPPIVWVFWWQGEDHFPEIIRLCQNSKMRSAGNHQVVLLTQYNIKDYIDFPDYIWEQWESGKLKIQHLADMIRIRLLRRYGGLWLDASVFCVQDIPEEVFQTEFFSIRGKHDISYVSENKWTTFVIGGKKGNVLFAFLDDFFMEYGKSGKPFIDYFMFDCAIAVAYEKIPSVRSEIDQLPEIQKSVYWLNEHLDENAEDRINELKKQFIFQKIGWNHFVNRQIAEDSLLQALMNDGA